MPAGSDASVRSENAGDGASVGERWPEPARFPASISNARTERAVERVREQPTQT
jgi:hypothetical protein